MRARKPGTFLRALAAIVLLLAVHYAGSTAVADEPLAKPTGPVILTITGAIGRTNVPGKAEFDMQMLEALGISSLTTSTSWTDGKQIFAGVLASKLLDAVQAKGNSVSASALDNYTIEIPASELRQYPVLFALTMNDKAMSLQDKGPIWIVYPRDDYPELRNPKIDRHWVWQLKSIDVKE